MWKGKTSQTNKSASKDPNETFKDFLVNDLPDSIAIITQDLTQCLFTNQTFSTLIDAPTSFDIKACLKEFNIHKDGEHKYKSAGHLKTLLDFVQYAVSHTDFQAGNKLSCIFTFQSKTDMSSNKPLVFEAKAFSKVWEGIPAISIILHDMTEHYTEMDRKIDDMRAGGTSHELRTPLNGILGLMQIVQKRTTDSTSSEYLDICSNLAHMALSMINSSLDLQQIRNGRLNLIPSKINLSKFLDETFHLFQYQCNNKNIALKLEISELTPKILNTDFHRLRQILIQLISNAVKFTFEGVITVSAKPSEDKKYVELAVKDTGIGMKDEDKVKIIRLLEEQKSIGLGLTVSDQLSRLMGGEEQRAGLSIDSTYGQGSVFSFWIKTNLANLEENVEQSEYVVESDQEKEEEDNNVEDIMGQHTMMKNPAVRF